MAKVLRRSRRNVEICDVIDMESLMRAQFSEVIPWDGVKGNAVFLCKMGGNA